MFNIHQKVMVLFSFVKHFITTLTAHFGGGGKVGVSFQPICGSANNLRKKKNLMVFSRSTIVHTYHPSNSKLFSHVNMDRHLLKQWV
jgi:hypothetical protein